MESNYTATNQSERIALIDILRGFAIFGILMVNLPFMYNGTSTVMLDIVYGDISTFQMVCESFVRFFFEGKFYIIFSLLFGYGFWLFMNKKAETGKSIIPIFRRRLFFLLLFGIAHVVFLWVGDILVCYALWGFLLIFFRKSSNKKIFVWAIIFSLILTVFYFFIVLLLSFVNQIPEFQTAMVKNTAETAETVKNILGVYSTGSYLEIMDARMQEYGSLIYGIICNTMSMAMFLIGVLIAKKRYIANWSEHLPKIKNTFWWTLGVGIFSNMIFMILKPSVSSMNPNWNSLWVHIMVSIGGIAFAFCYGSGIILLYAKRKENYLLGLLSGVGRMALTNYLCQSIIVAFIIYPFGLGLFGKIEIWQSILLTITVFIIQMYVSRWWLKKFYFGPFEWLWRCLTYGTIQPLLRK